MVAITCRKRAKKHNFIVSVYTSTQWMKLAQPAETIFLNPGVTDGIPAGDAG